MRWTADTEAGWWLRFVYSLAAPPAFLHLAFYGTPQLPSFLRWYLFLALLLAACSGVIALWPLFSSMWMRIPTLSVYVGVLSVVAFIYGLAAACDIAHACL